MAVTQSPLYQGGSLFLRPPRADASLRGVNADRGLYKEDTDLAGSGLKACKSPDDRGDRRASKRILGLSYQGLSLRYERGSKRR